ncbi:CCNJL protein, partial [Polyodon spathula]|nr:CCNJL protein [Polyodon spathula]
MCTLNLVLNKKDLIKMEVLLLETFSWNLCMPTAAHFIDYYLYASVQENDLHNGWPLTSITKTKAFIEKYTHYFLEVSLQDHSFLSFRPSQVAAACIAASRICLQISPSWTTQLHLLTGYTWDHLTQCIELMLMAHDNDVKEANKTKTQQPSIQQPPVSYTHLSQHSTPLSQLHTLAEAQVLAPVVPRDYLQAHRATLLSSSASASNCTFHSYPSLPSSLQPPVRTLPIQGPISMQVAIATEPRHCLSVAYGSSYLSGHHSFAAGCFDR